MPAESESPLLSVLCLQDAAGAEGKAAEEREEAQEVVSGMGGGEAELWGRGLSGGGTVGSRMLSWELILRRWAKGLLSRFSEAGAC